MRAEKRNKLKEMKRYINLAAILIMVTLLSSCSAIAGIFKAGAAVGIIGIVIIIAIIIWVISMFRGRN